MWSGYIHSADVDADAARAVELGGQICNRPEDIPGVGRFAVIVPVLAIAGSLAAKKRIAATVGTLPTHGPLFVVLLIGTVLLVGLLNYVPALALGPVVEHLMLPAH